MKQIDIDRLIELRKSRGTALKAKHQTKRGREAISKKETKMKREGFIAPTHANNDMNKGPLFKTKEVDYDTKILLRIDKRTTIYIKAGEDPVQARENYLKKYSKP